MPQNSAATTAAVHSEVDGTLPDFDRVEAITFDCYGTLIDWESGLSGNAAAAAAAARAESERCRDSQTLW